jgi:thymidylate kinase
MFTLAFIGPDGAGKTTIGRRLEREFPLPVKYLYMGTNPDASNCLLPTTRLARAVKRRLGADAYQGGPPDPSRRHRQPKGIVRRGLRKVKSGVGLANRMAEEWRRQAVAWRYRQRGWIVVFDRHFFADYYFHDIAPQGERPTWTQRLHGYVLKRLYPRPDLTILLDAPAETLFARKPEGTLELLERRRQEYLRLREAAAPCIVVDASQSEDMVWSDVVNHVAEFYRCRTGRTLEFHHDPQREAACPSIAAP